MAQDRSLEAVSNKINQAPLMAMCIYKSVKILKSDQRLILY